MDVIVVGLGKIFRELSEVISQKYNVIYVSDSYYSDVETEYQGFRYVPITEIPGGGGFDLVIICSIEFYWEIRESLLALGKVSPDKISDYYMVWELRLMKKGEEQHTRLQKFKADMEKYEALNADKNRFPLVKDRIRPFIYEYDEPASKVSIFYMLFEHWCAKHIYKERPAMHYDIGGRFEGFINRLLTFDQEVTMIDIRPFKYEIDGLHFVQSDALLLENIADESVESLSCLGVLHSMGLGRYGDAINPDAWEICLKSIQRVMKKGGKVYIADSVGKECLQFNLGRIFYAETIVNALNEMELLEYTVTDETKDCEHYYDVNCGLHDYDDNENHRVFGCFKFKKI